ncbi:hypothetical protein LSH36_149g04002 [Paralvinella palmiformis]|uniref:CCHC-type domain-containing protein n=1 Tax=Paralvinella palmiformis TaxID=53620 RepID=A0AAD9JV92_9ANNE|nr:hypothetical protein LSH36_149g04002 [Paralvinella palmiformis]
MFGVTGKQSSINRSACKKCGYVGHLTFQCRNFQKVDPSRDIVLDVSSTSSESEDEFITPLQLLAAGTCKRTIRIFLKHKTKTQSPVYKHKKHRKHKSGHKSSSKKKEHRSGHHSSSQSDSDLEPDKSKHRFRHHSSSDSDSDLESRRKKHRSKHHSQSDSDSNSRHKRSKHRHHSPSDVRGDLGVKRKKAKYYTGADKQLELATRGRRTYHHPQSENDDDTSSTVESMDDSMYRQKEKHLTIKHNRK